MGVCVCVCVYTIQQGVMGLEIIFVKGLVLSSVSGAQQALNKPRLLLLQRGWERLMGGQEGAGEGQDCEGTVGGDRARSRGSHAAFQSEVTRGQ